MEKVIAGLFALVALMFFAPLSGVLAGAFSGFVVGLFFEDSVLDFLRRVGVDTTGLPLWQVGAAMGFLGSFLKSSSVASTNN